MSMATSCAQTHVPSSIPHEIPNTPLSDFFRIILVLVGWRPSLVGGRPAEMYVQISSDLSLSNKGHHYW